jgi:hypothetical protein
MDNLEKNFILAINKSFEFYNQKGGARSNKKLIPIHKFLSDVILSKLKNGYVVKSLGVGNGKEEKFEGKYYPKNLDIAVLKNDKVVATLSFKFVTSNYQQNSNNYFENLIGETANLRRLNIGFAHFLVLRGHTPYYSKNKDNLRGALKKVEVISNKNIQKYIKLSNDIDFPHKPDLIGISILDIKNNKLDFVDLDDFDFSNETKKIFKNNFSIKVFVNKFIHLVKLKS